MRIRAILNACLFFLSGCWPRKGEKVIFGAWLGTKFADNPKYLALYLARRELGLDLVWVGDPGVQGSIPPGLPIRFVRRGSLAGYREMLTASCCFITHSTQDLARWNVLRGARVVYLGHGVALKHMGTPDVPLPSALLNAARLQVRKAECYAFLVASSAKHGQKLLREYAINGATQESILRTGQPRIDFLIENNGTEAGGRIRERLLSEQGIPLQRRTITYLPTFRDKRQRSFSFLTLTGAERERLEAILEKYDAVILEKSHFADAQREGEPGAKVSSRCFSLAGNRVDTQELLLSSDVLITDYSGCFFDYLLLDRPIIHFAYDRDYYTRKDRGLYFDLTEAAGGPVVEVFGSLCDAMEEALARPSLHHDQRDRVRQSLMTFESGNASTGITRAVLGIDS